MTCRHVPVRVPGLTRRWRCGACNERLNPPRCQGDGITADQWAVPTAAEVARWLWEEAPSGLPEAELKALLFGRFPKLALETLVVASAIVDEIALLDSIDKQVLSGDAA